MVVNMFEVLDSVINTATDRLDGVFGGIPFHTLENNINDSTEVTSRKTQLGFEDNDHRFSKSSEVNLQVILTGLVKKERYLALEMMSKKREKAELILMKKFQIYQNMVITEIKQKESYQEGMDCILLDISFKEIRYGEPTGTLVQSTAENITTPAEMFQQTIGTVKNKLARMQQIFLGGR